METLKQLLAFPVYATVAWLVWVLAQQVGPAGLLAALIGLVLIGACRLVVQHRADGARRGAAALALGTVAAVADRRRGRHRRPRPRRAGDRAAGCIARPATSPSRQQRLDELLAADRPVFVNMTAAWCITCLVNEHAALSTAAVKAAFAARNIAYLKGDWTSRNPEITRVLERHGRSGVPLYLLYAGGAEPVVLPQILTPAIVLGEIDRIPGAAAAQGLPSTPAQGVIACSSSTDAPCWLPALPARPPALALGLTCAPGTANPAAQARIGAPAPGFTLTDSNGKSVSLADFKGKTVVLEWTNHDCPYVRKHYGGNAMQALQKKWTGQGVVWLTVISSMPGSQGYVTAEQANKLTADRGAAPDAPCCSTPRATSAAPTARKRRRTCTSSPATARSSTWAASTTRPPPGSKT